jgi:hypothetical protein
VNVTKLIKQIKKKHIQAYFRSNDYDELRVKLRVESSHTEPCNILPNYFECEFDKNYTKQVISSYVNPRLIHTVTA